MLLYLHTLCLSTYRSIDSEYYRYLDLLTNNRSFDPLLFEMFKAFKVVRQFSKFEISQRKFDILDVSSAFVSEIQLGGML